MRAVLVASAFVASMLAASPAHADPITSTFDTDADGWTPHLNDGAVITFHASGGNPLGHISVDDVTDDWAYVQAPSKFLVPALYGGALSFDLKHFNNDPRWPLLYSVRVALVGNGLTLINEGGLPTTSWVNHSFTLTELAGWRIFSNLSQDYSSLAPAPTQAQILGVLGNLTGLFIATDYTDGNVLSTNSIDRTYLDNVSLDVAGAQVPEPATVALLVVGLGALCLSRRRRATAAA